MGIMDYMGDLYASLTWQETEAEAPESDNDEQQEDSGEGKEEGEGEESSEGGDSEEGGDEGGDDEEEEEEEEEEEPEDPMPKLQEECMKTAQCAPLKHHYDECAERVMKQEEESGKAQEDCVEEYFHLMHCAAQCAAPKLFKQLR